MEFYVERTDLKYPYDRRHVSLIDTHNLDTNYQIEHLFHQRVNENTRESMFTIEYNSPRWKCLKEGSWYDLSQNVLLDFEYEHVNRDLPGGAYLRAHLRGPLQDIDFTRYLCRPKYMNSDNFYPLELHPTSENLTLNIIDCGQGNWNELVSNRNRIFYDFGASSQYTYDQVRALVQSRRLSQDRRPIHILLSHWDIDHYHSLLGCSASDLASIRMFVAPSLAPDTSTYRRILEVLEENGVTISWIPPSNRPAGSGRHTVLCLHSQHGPYKLYRAVPGRSRNQSGIVISVDGPNYTAILTGDHHYEKILNAIRGNHANINGILVVPHHGGHAGTIDISDWNSEFSTLSTPISVGANNPYRHPHQYIIRDLCQLQGSQPLQTCNNGDLTYNL